jgi:hypothetical protein
MPLNWFKNCSHYPSKDRISDRLWAKLHDDEYDDFPSSPQEFTDKEIDCIGTWQGEGSDHRFGGSDAEQKLIVRFGLDVTAGENTWPKFAAVLRARKDEWAQANPERMTEKRALEMLESAIHASAELDEVIYEARQECIRLGMKKSVVRDREKQFRWDLINYSKP